MFARSWMKPGLALVLGFVAAAGCKSPPPPEETPSAKSVPTVVSTDPADGSVNVAETLSAVRVTFSDAMDPESINASTFLLKQDGSTLVQGSVTYDAGSHQATLTPAAPLYEGHNYVGTLTAAAKSEWGVPLAAAFNFSFTTRSVPPTVVSTTPVDNATNVPGNQAIAVVFSEAMDAASFTNASFQVKQGSAAVSGSYQYDATSKTATFQPTGSYAGGSTISVLLNSGVKDRSGIGLAATVSRSFTVSNAPSVASSTPAPNDVNVLLASPISLTFSAAMDAATLIAANIWIEDSSQAKVAASYSLTGSTGLGMAPQSPLIESSVYTVVVTTAVKSALGVPFAAEYRFSFTTIGIPPTVISTSPADGSRGAAMPRPALTVTFSEPMAVATFTNANVRLFDGANDLPATVAASGTTQVVLTPTVDLFPLWTYTGILTTGLTDLKGNAMAQEYRFSFTTEDLPRIVSMQPLHNATAATNARIRIQFNKAIASTLAATPASATTNTQAFTLFDGSGARVDGDVLYDPASFTARIQMKRLGALVDFDANKRYTLVIDRSKVLDANGNALVGGGAFGFSTGASPDSTPPAVTAVSPADAVTGVRRDSVVYADFSQALDPATLSSANIQVLDGGTPVVGQLSYDASLRRVSFKAAGLLAPLKTFTFSIGAGVANLAGVAKGAANTTTFTTVDNDAPALVSAYPADGSVGVKLNQSIRLTFSKDIDPASLSLSIKHGSGGALTQAGATSYDAASRSVVFVPTAGLANNDSYSVTVLAGLKDLEGKATAADILASSFATVNDNSTDPAAPIVTATVPANAATQVSALQAVLFDFSKALDPRTVAPANITFKVAGAAGANVNYRASFDATANRLTLTSTRPLSANTLYDVALSAAIKDMGGNALDAATAAFSFTVDSVAPTAAPLSPAANSTVGASTTVSLQLSEAMQADTVGAATIGLSGTAAVVAGVGYDPVNRTATLVPAQSLADGLYTVSLGGMLDLAGNALAATSYTFTVNNSAPSVLWATPCGTMVDAYDLGTQIVTVKLDRPVKRTAGGALTTAEIHLQDAAVPGTDVASTVTHTAGTDTATLQSSQPLGAGKTYNVLVTASGVADNATGNTMLANYTCSFSTQKVILKDAIDLASPGYTAGAAVGGNNWVLGSSSMAMPAPYTSVVWRAGNQTDGSMYARSCPLVGAGTDYKLTLERTVDLSSITSSAELRFDSFYQLGGDANGTDLARVIVKNDGKVLKTFSGTNNAFQTGLMKGSANLDAYKGLAAVTLHFELLITSRSGFQACPAGAKGWFIDNLWVVGN